MGAGDRVIARRHITITFRPRRRSCRASGAPHRSERRADSAAAAGPRRRTARRPSSSAARARDSPSLLRTRTEAWPTSRRRSGRSAMRVGVAAQARKRWRRGIGARARGRSDGAWRAVRVRRRCCWSSGREPRLAPRSIYASGGDGFLHDMLETARRRRRPRATSTGSPSDVSDGDGAGAGAGGHHRAAYYGGRAINESDMRRGGTALAVGARREESPRRILLTRRRVRCARARVSLTATRRLRARALHPEAFK